MSQEKSFYLGIGAPRSGTTWLYRNLRGNSDVYMSPIKELRFFGGMRSEELRATQYAKALEEADGNALDTAFLNAWSTAKQGTVEDYLPMFPDQPKVGEISPIYCVQPAKRIAYIKEAMGDRKPHVFMMLRNPLDRDLSHVVFTLHYQRNRKKPYTEQEYLDFINTPAFKQRSQYKRAHRLWGDAFGDDFQQFFYDDLNEDPRKFYEHFCNSMGIVQGEERVKTAMINTSHSGAKFSVTLPQSVYEQLFERNMIQVPRMEFIAGERRKIWRAQMEEKIAKLRD